VAELATLHTSLLRCAREACPCLRPGNWLPHASGDATTLVYAYATTFIHAYAATLIYACATTTLKRATLIDARRSSTVDIFAEPTLLAVHAAKPLFATSCARDRAAANRLLGDARVRSPVAGPVGPPLIERPPGIVAGPVAAEDERHDRNINHVNVVGQINVSVSIVILQIFGRNPAAVAGPAYIAPRVTPEATMDVDVGAAGNSVDHWKAGARAGP
jgi:hypothetical protein